jgi:O-antigen/teichoic acid export membrane protein
MVYLGMGIPRLVLGSILIWVSPTETSAMLGVALGLVVPALVGWHALRRGRVAGQTSDDHELRPVLRETVRNSVALLAFFVLSNADIVLARNVLDGHDAGLYAGGLILTKAVLFLPQFVVVVAFPSMAGAGDQRRALTRSLTAVLGLGLLSTAASVVLSAVALIFVGGPEYAEVESLLWIFSVLGTLLAMLQLLVYSVLARQGTRSTLLIWGAVLVLLASTTWIHSLAGLLVTVTAIDGALFAVLLGLGLWRPPPSLARR